MTERLDAVEIEIGTSPRAPCCVSHQALQLVTPMRWHLGVGVE